MTDERIQGYDLKAIFAAAPQKEPGPLTGKYWPEDKEDLHEAVEVNTAYDFGYLGLVETDARLITTWGTQAIEDYRKGLEDRRAIAFAGSGTVVDIVDFN